MLLSIIYNIIIIILLLLFIFYIIRKDNKTIAYLLLIILLPFLIINVLLIVKNSGDVVTMLYNITILIRFIILVVIFYLTIKLFNDFYNLKKGIEKTKQDIMNDKIKINNKLKEEINNENRRLLLFTFNLINLIIFILIL